jgi:hypothetical protein
MLYYIGVYLGLLSLRVKQALEVSEWDAEKGIRPKRKKVTEAWVNFMIVSLH